MRVNGVSDTTADTASICGGSVTPSNVRSLCPLTRCHARQYWRLLVCIGATSPASTAGATRAGQSGTASRAAGLARTVPADSGGPQLPAADSADTPVFHLDTPRLGDWRKGRRLSEIGRVPFRHRCLTMGQRARSCQHVPTATRRRQPRYQVPSSHMTIDDSMRLYMTQGHPLRLQGARRRLVLTKINIPVDTCCPCCRRKSHAVI